MAQSDHPRVAKIEGGGGVGVPRGPEGCAVQLDGEPVAQVGAFLALGLYELCQHRRGFEQSAHVARDHSAADRQRRS